MIFKLIMPNEFFVGNKTIKNLSSRLCQNHYEKVIFVVDEQKQQYKNGLKIIRKIKTKEHDTFKYERQFSVQKNIEQLIEVMQVKKYDMVISIGTKIIHDIARLAGAATINNISAIFDHSASYEFKKNMPFTCISLEKYTLNAISSTIIVEGSETYFFNSKSFIPRYLIYDQKYANVFNLEDYKKTIGYLLYVSLKMVSDPKTNLICATLAASGVNTLLTVAKKIINDSNYVDENHQLIYASYSILSALNNIRITHDQTIYTPLMLMARYLQINNSVDFYNYIINNNRYFFYEFEQNKWDLTMVTKILTCFTNEELIKEAKELFDLCEVAPEPVTLSRNDYKSIQKLQSECVQDAKLTKLEKWLNDKGDK